MEIGTASLPASIRSLVQAPILKLERHLSKIRIDFESRH